MVVPQIEASQINFGKHAEGEAPQQVGVEEEQLERRHGVKGAGVDLADLVVLEIKVPKDREWREKCRGVERQGKCSQVTPCLPILTVKIHTGDVAVPPVTEVSRCCCGCMTVSINKSSGQIALFLQLR